MTGEEPAFRRAIDQLDAESLRPVGTRDLVPAAVSAQTKVPIATLQAQHAETGLSYGELLVADSLAVASGKSFAQILRMRAKTLTWAELSLQLRINPNSLAARADGARKEIYNTRGRYNRQHSETIYGLNFLRMPNSQTVPRSFGRGPSAFGG